MDPTVRFDARDGFPVVTFGTGPITPADVLVLLDEEDGPQRPEGQTTDRRRAAESEQGGEDVEDGLLTRLVGFRLYSVQFGLDHVQLRFETDASPHMPVLNCDALPRLRTPDGSLASGEPGYADAFIGLIEEDVTAVVEAAGAGFVVVLGGTKVVLDPSPEEVFGEEIAMLSGFFDGSSWIWRPGEEPFEHL
ncbi:hypothetical protein [Marmoricola sp. RAF53]|uniref:hypothetical protein n=1 Tax=Marmoricola sp. RAF53 TaxID=3233059 RepID=UPI003F989A76